MHIAQVWTYPVKSMVGVQIDGADLTELGFSGDRRWAVRSLEIGGIRGAKKIGPLMLLSAVESGGAAVITLPDGSTVSSRDSDVDQRISAAIGHRVVLQELPPADDHGHFRRGPSTNTDPLAELREIFGREEHEPLPDFTAFPPEVVEFESPPGTHHDCWPLMVMSTSALQALADALPGSNVDVRRFRPSIVVDTGDDPGHPEFSWTGRTATIGAGPGAAVIEFLKPCPRCVMTTRAVAGGIPEDRAVLRHIVRDLDQNLGVYARVLGPGRVAVGDTLTFG